MEYGESATDLGAFDSSLAIEGILILDAETGDEKRRFKHPLPADCSWVHLNATCRAALGEVRQHLGDGRVSVLVVSQHIHGDNGDAIHGFFQSCRNLWSLGFSKCRFVDPEAALLVLDAVMEVVADRNVPKWERPDHAL